MANIVRTTGISIRGGGTEPRLDGGKVLRLTRLVGATLLAVLLSAAFTSGGSPAYAGPTGGQAASATSAKSVDKTDTAGPRVAGPVSPQSALGTSPINSFSYTWNGITIAVPAGCFFTHYINGDGQMVNYQRVGTDCAGPGYWWGGFCNYSFELHYYNLQGKEYASPRKSGLYSACSFNTYHEFKVNTRYLVGKACAWFIVGGVHRATQCHNILAD